MNLLITHVTTGNWKGSIPIPRQSFQEREECLHGEDRIRFLQFIRRKLCWNPEERPTAEELALDDFMMQQFVVTGVVSLSEAVEVLERM